MFKKNKSTSGKGGAVAGSGKAKTRKGRESQADSAAAAAAAAETDALVGVTKTGPNIHSRAPAALAEKLLKIQRQNGIEVEKHVPGKRAIAYSLRYDSESNRIVWTLKSKHVGSFDVGDIREIRVGQPALDCKDFKASSDYARAAATPELCIVFMHGKEFKLKQFCVVAPDAAEATAFVDAIYSLTRERNPDHYRTNEIVGRWLFKSWHQLVKEGSNSLSLREVKSWLQRINLKLSTKDMKDYLSTIDTTNQGSIIGNNNFKKLYHLLLHDDRLLSMFARFSTDKSTTNIARKIISPKDLSNFLKEIQREKWKTSDVKHLQERYSGGDAFTIGSLIEYLFSTENSIWDSYYDSIVQDMTQPLSDYFVASSHNTYLMGDQLRSESSTEAYVRCLRDGCRCIEIDCWDGTGKEPCVTHGHTLCTKINFRDVLPVIRDHAFIYSEYPLILSIENHCSLDQQNVMANCFKETFRDSLLSEPLEGTADREQYPSPQELKRRIIIKHKKLKDGSGDVLISTNKTEDDISSSVKNGPLLLEDKLDGSWNKHYFVLTNERIFYAVANDDERNAALEDEDEDEDDPFAIADDIVSPELHDKEDWFYAKLKDGRVAAEGLLKDYNGEEGTFLVRESDTFPNEYSLSFWRNGQAQHCRIRCNQGQYFLTDLISFVNLYELIEYYRREPLKSAQFRLILKDGVPQPAPHQGQKWFHEGLSRAAAEDMLRRVKEDGAYLVRQSESAEQSFAISFRAERKTKHCRVRKEGRKFCIGDAEFDSLVKLIEYYQQVPLYRKIKLKYAVDDELLARAEQEEAEEDIYNSDELYSQPNAFETAAEADSETKTNGVACKALHAYRASQSDELSFPKDAIITNVVKSDDGWWRGHYAATGLTGFLPANYVAEIDLESMVNEDKEDAENPLGILEQATMSVNGLTVTPQPSRNNQRLIMRLTQTVTGKAIDVGVETEEDFHMWAKAIQETAKAYSAKQDQRKRMERRMRIHKELSDLVFYSQSVAFKNFEESKTQPYYVMSSFPEKKAETNATNNAHDFIGYNCRQISRVYPAGKRVDSSNFCPQLMWNAGCQLVALNYQTGDKPMWLNYGKFKMNGRCGMVLKPAIMRTPSFDPFNHKTWTHSVDRLQMKLTIIGARHLVKPTRGIASPFVEVEVLGVPNDSQLYKTKIVQDNGFNPIWEDSKTFDISLPELACLRFVVLDEDMFGDANAIGQAVFPVGPRLRPAIRNGYRSVPLLNIYNEPLELASLLVRVEYTDSKKKSAAPDAEYQGLQELKSEVRKYQNERDTLVKEKLRAQSTSTDIPAGLEARLLELNALIAELEEKLMQNPLEQARASDHVEATPSMKAHKKHAA